MSETAAKMHDPVTCRNGDHYGQCSGVTPPFVKIPNPLTRRYVAADHERFCTLTFPDGMVPPLSITLEGPPAGNVVFWYDPGPIESLSTATTPDTED